MQRMNSLRSIVLAASILALSACGKPPAHSAYMNRGQPESLLDVSSEIINLSTTNPSDITDLATWIKKDMPTRAQLNCAITDPSCTKAQKLLDANNIPSVNGTGSDATVTLIYERILAHDCNARYVDNPHNFYNTNHRNFGCATAANMAQAVTNKQAFTNPSLSDNPSATRAINDIRRAYKPRPVVEPYAIKECAVTTK